MEVPHYPELSVGEIWCLIKEIDDITVYFPDYTSKQKPDRDYMYSVLATTRYQILKKIVENARIKRAKENDPVDDGYIFIEKSMLMEIEDVVAQKSKCYYKYFSIATKGSAHFLLKKNAKIKRQKQPAKRYSVNLSDLKASKEQNKKEEEDRMT